MSNTEVNEKNLQNTPLKEGELDLLTARFKNIISLNGRVAVLEEEDGETGVRLGILKKLGMIYEHTADEITDLFRSLLAWERVKKGNTISNLYSYIIQRGSLDIHQMLMTFEPAVRTIYVELYKGKTCKSFFKVKDAKVEYTIDCGTGESVVPGDDFKYDIFPRQMLGVFQDVHLRLWDVRLEKDKVYLANIPRKGKDDAPGLIEQLARTYGVYRNNLIHGSHENNHSIYDDEDKDSKRDAHLTNDETTYPSAANTVLALFLHILDYRFDIIHQKIDPIVEKFGKSVMSDNTEAIQAQAEKYINEDYVDSLIKEADKELDSLTLIDLTVTPSPRLISENKQLSRKGDPDSESDDSASRDLQTIDLTEALCDSGNRRLVICGESGAGKSTSTTRLVKWLAEKRKSGDKSVPLPIRVNLNTFSHKYDWGNIRIPDVVGVLLNDATRNCVNEIFKKMADEGDIIVFLDGFNEVLGKQRKPLVDKLRETFGSVYPAMRFVVTSRIDEARNDLASLSGLTSKNIDKVGCYTLNRLNDDQIKGFLKRRATTEDEGLRLATCIEESKALRAMSRNPMQLSMVVRMLLDKAGASHNLATLNRAELYNEYTCEYIHRELSQSGTFDDEMMQEILDFTLHALTAAAAALMKSGKGSVTGIDLNKVGNDVPHQQYLIYASRAGIIRKKESVMAFAHESFGNFFKARHIVNLPLPRLVTCIRDMVVKANSPELLRMIIETSIVTDREDDAGHPRLPLIMSSYHRLMHEENPDGLVNHGLVVLADIVSKIPVQPAPYRDLGDGLSCAPATVHNLFDAFVLEDMRRFRDDFISGREPNLAFLLVIFSIVAASESRQLVDEIFRPFWIRFWALHDIDNETRGIKPLYASLKATSVVLGNLKHMTDIHLKIFDLVNRLKACGLDKSSDHVKATFARQWVDLNDDSLRRLCDYLLATGKDEDRSDAAMAMMSMSDPAWVDSWDLVARQVAETYGKELQCVATVRIIYKQMAGILRRDRYSDRIFDIIWESVSKKEYQRLVMCQSVAAYGLYRDLVVPELRQRLAKARQRRAEARALNEYGEIKEIDKRIAHLCGIAKLYPLSTFTDDELEDFGLQKNVAYLTVNAPASNDLRIPYIISGVPDKKRFFVLVPDIGERFTGSRLRMPVLTPGLTHKEYVDHAVVNDTASVLSRTRVSLRRCDTDHGMPLPMHGTISDLPGFPAGVEYFARSASSEQQELEIYNSVQRDAYASLMGARKCVHVDSIPCQVDAVETDEARRYRMLVVNRVDGVTPVFEDLAYLVDANGNIKTDIDTTPATPEEYRLGNYHNVITDLSQGVDYQVYGYKPGIVMLWTGVSNPEKGMSLEVCGEKPAKTAIRSVEPFQGSFIEIHLIGNFGATPPALCGNLVNISGSAFNINNQIPYIYSHAVDNHVMVRVAQQYLVELLRSDPQMADRMIGEQRYRIGMVPVRITRMEIIDHVPGSKCISIDLPEAGMSPSGKLRLKSSTNGPVKLELLKGMRPPLGVIEGLIKNGAAPDSSHPLLQTDNMRYRSAPAQLWVKLPGQPRVLKATKTITKTGNLERVVIELHADDIHIADGTTIGAVQLMYRCPVNNSPEVDPFRLSNHYAIDDVNYYIPNTKTKKIRLPRPASPLRSLYYRIDGGPVCRVGESDISPVLDGKSAYFERCDMAVGADVDVKSDGRVRFFYDAEARYPASIEYEGILSLISLNTPSLYHRETAALVVAECSGKGLFTLQACDFIAALGAESLLYREFLNDSVSQRSKKYPEDLRFNICMVLARDGCHAILYSTKSLLVEEASVPVDEWCTPGALVLLEADGHVVPVGEPPRSLQCGYLRGVVIHSAGNDVHIRVPGQKADFYYHYPDSDPLERGDVVTFLPAVNPRYLKIFDGRVNYNGVKRMASRVVRESSVVHPGKVVSRDEEPDKVMLVIQGLEHPGQYKCTLPKDPGQWLYRRFGHLSVGDDVDYFVIDEVVKGPVAEGEAFLI